MESLENNQELSTFLRKYLFFEMPSSPHNNGSAPQDFYGIAILLCGLTTPNLIRHWKPDMLCF